jgi:hypothetical protein
MAAAEGRRSCTSRFSAMHSSLAPHFSATLQLAVFSTSTTISSLARARSSNPNLAILLTASEQ